jgi:hypothetical protein
MSNWCRGAVALCLAVLALPLVGGCGDGTTEGPAAVAQGGPGGPGGPAPKSNPAIKQIMVKAAKGPQSLTGLIGKELSADPTPWDTIGPQSKELATLAASMGELEPPMGTKESWQQQTSAYAADAAGLAMAAEAKDLQAALESHGALSRSCISCHRAHRGGGPGMGKGGFGPRGGRGGPPPGSPGLPADDTGK